MSLGERHSIKAQVGETKVPYFSLHIISVIWCSEVEVKSFNAAVCIDYLGRQENLTWVANRGG